MDTARRRSGACLAAALALAFALACGRPQAICARCNAVLVLVDTLRADHLGSYGYARATSPAFDAFAASGARFANVHSQAACTFPSVNSLLTGRHVFGFLDPETRPTIPERYTTLASRLAAHGYRTAAVSASPVVRDKPGRFNPRGGFGRGFEHFDEICTWEGAACVNDRASRLLDELTRGDGEAERPFFLYLHYMDPHDPYRPPPEIRGTFSGAYDGPHRFIAEGDPNPLATRIAEAGEDRVEIAAEDLDHLIDLYDEMILAFDRGFARLLEMLAARGLAEDTVVVVASDHGEAFFEHGYVKHCYTVFENETRVPLAIRVPRMAPVAVAEAVQNLDIVPTLLDYLGLDAGAPRSRTGALDGASLRPLIEGRGPLAPRFAYSDTGYYRGVNDRRYKLILDLRAQRFSLYDLVRDPGERRDVLGAERRRFRVLYRSLIAWLEDAEGVLDEREQLERAREIEAELRALGYLG